MTAVRMFIDKFNGVVLIDEDHPLAVAQREKPAARSVHVPPVPPAPGASVPPVSASKFARMGAAYLAACCAERSIAVPEGSTRKDMIALLTAPPAPPESA